MLDYLLRVIEDNVVSLASYGSAKLALEVFRFGLDLQPAFCATVETEHNTEDTGHPAV